MREKLRHETVPEEFSKHKEMYVDYLNTSLGFDKYDNGIKSTDLNENKCERYFFKDVANFTLGNT